MRMGFPKNVNVVGRIVIGTALTVSTAFISGMAEQKLAGASEPVPAVYFGLHIHRAATTTAWPESKFGSWRLMDAYVIWPNLEPEKGKWDFSKLDLYVKQAEGAGVEILLPLAFSPRWASARPDENSPYGPGNAAEPAQIEDWRNYVRTVATRYKGRVRHYELWNEVNTGFYTGSQEKLIELAQEAYRILKEIDLGNVLVSPSVVGAGKHLIWFDDYLRKGGAKYLDVVGYHFYVPAESPEAMLGLVKAVKTIMAKNGVSDKPLWNTETGWWVANTDGTPETGVAQGWKRLTPDEAAAYVSRALILGKAAGFGRFYWYSWDHKWMGLIEPASKATKPAGRAYDQTYKWLSGSTLLGCSQSGSIWKCDSKNRDGGRSWLVWTTDPAATWAPPNGWQGVSYETLDNTQHTLSRGASVPVTEAPVRVIGRPATR